MVEIGIGVLFAVIFVTAYLLVKKFLGRKGRWREIANQPFGSKVLNAKSPKLFLPASEMRKNRDK